MEVEEVERKLKDEEDEEEWKEKETVGNRWKIFEKERMHLVAKQHVV